MEERMHPFNQEILMSSRKLDGLPCGIIQARSDLELRPLWLTSSKLTFLPEKFTIILFHYDGNVKRWWDLEWSNQAIRIVAHNQTKWWFAKRFLHPDVVSIYDYIFLWDEDLGVEDFNPARYLEIVRETGLEISQPALHPNSSDIYHRIKVRAEKKKFHRRFYDSKDNVKCTEESRGPPCTRIHWSSVWVKTEEYNGRLAGPHSLLSSQNAGLWKVWLRSFQDLPGIALGILYRIGESSFGPQKQSKDCKNYVEQWLSSLQTLMPQLADISEGLSA